MERYDYILIGAGSAGCVLADRLTASGKARVLLLERGPADRSPWISIPAGYGKLFYHPTLNYGFQAEAEAALNGRADYWPRGRVVGGSGSINAMVYCRGLPGDFDDWEAAGATGWGWEAVRSVYDRIETRHMADGRVLGDGPLQIFDASPRIHRANRHYFNALRQLNLPITDDLNGDRPEGGAVYQINTKNGQRWSAAKAHLAPALKRGNLHLKTDTTVRRLLFDGSRAIGVELEQHGRFEQFHATQVILCAGAVHSPQLLQLSGIGPAKLLQDHGITIHQANDAVGGNLQDHLGINYYFKATEPTLNNVLSPWYGKLWAGLKYVLARRGPLALSVNQCGGFFRTSADLRAPDQQLYFNPVTYTKAKIGTRNVIHPDPFPGFILGMQPCRPTSRGRIDLQSTEPDAAPRITANPLATEEDRAAVIAGGRFCAKIAETPALQTLIQSPMYCDIRALNDAEILEDFRDRCGTVFHPIGTCRMGSDPARSVVDPALKLHGIDGLRVVDASVFPNVTSGNTNAPTMMLAHRAADLILNEAT